MIDFKRVEYLDIRYSVHFVDTSLVILDFLPQDIIIYNVDN